MKKEKKKATPPYLTCKRVYFYCLLDEDIFFHWIEKIECITSFDEASDEVYLNLKKEPLNYHEFRELGSLLFRYEIDMTQLHPLINEQNKGAVTSWKNLILKENEK